MASPSSAPCAACRHRTMRFGSHGQPPLRARRSGQRIRGPFAEVGGVAQQSLTVWNTGEFGTDTFNISRGLELACYPLSGPARLTPLADTNGDGIPDTGPTAPGASGHLCGPGVPVPAERPTSEIRTRRKSNADLIARSDYRRRAARCQGVVPAPFVQTYTQSQAPKIAFHRPTSLTTQLAAPASGYSPVVATAPNGNIVQVWSGPSRTNGNAISVSELHLARLGQSGQSRHTRQARG